MPSGRPIYERNPAAVAAGHSYDIERLKRRLAPDFSHPELPYPTFYSIPLFDDGIYYADTASSNSRISRVALDATVPHGAVRNNFDNYGSTRTATDGDNMAVAVRLGPSTVWCGISIGCKRGPDFGKLKISYGGPMSEARYVAPSGYSGGDPIDGSYAIEGYGDIGDGLNGLSWVDYFETIDCYNSIESLDQEGVLGDFRIMGATADDKLSAFSAPGSGDPFPRKHGNGGPGIYLVKFEVAGKNASSSGYKLALWSLTFNIFDDWAVGDFA